VIYLTNRHILWYNRPRQLQGDSLKRTLVTGAILIACVFAAVGYLLQAKPGNFEEEAIKADFSMAGPQAQAALEQYPLITPRVFLVYGQAEEFQAALHEFGHNQLVPIINKCLEGGDTFLEAGNAFNQIVGNLLQFQAPKVEPLTPEKCGATVILLTLNAKNDFLGQFDVNTNTGVARRLPGSSVLAIAKGIATSGLQNLERKLVGGQKTNWKDWGGAALDAVAIAAVAKSVALVAKTRLAAQTARGAKVGTAAKVAEARTGITAFALSNTPRVAKYLTIGGIGYLVIFYPNVISSAVGTIAEILGVDPLLLQIIVWAAILFLPFLILLNILSFLKGFWLVVSSPVRIGRWLHRISKIRTLKGAGAMG
jgi:hypothetical protein